MFFAATVSIAMAHSMKPGDAVSYSKLIRGKAKFHVVTADLNSGVISPETTSSKKLTSIWTMIGSEQPIAAITGTFFHMKSGRPVGDVLVDGSLVAKGYRGSAIGVSYFGEVKIFDTIFKKAYDWGEYRFGIRGTIRIVAGGKVQPNPKLQNFRDKRLWGRASRTGIGITGGNKIVLMATTNPVTLSEMGKAMLSIGVQNAISLDGGGSTALYYKGSLVVSPKRKLCNYFVLKPMAVAQWGTP
jgi:exopolysaccharide biosynthesis protein